MSKITLANLTSLANATTAINTINSNSSITQNAVDNTLSRDGTSPNQMGAAIDMNSNRIINLPVPVSNQEPIRLTDLTTLTNGGNVVFNALPTGGTVGQTIVKNTSTDYDVHWSNPIQTVNDTNVTLAISATNPETLTAGWTGTLANGRIAPGSNSTVKGTASGVVTDLTQTQLTALVNPFTSSLSGAVSGSGGGGTNFLRADNVWATQPLWTLTSITGNGTSSVSGTYTPGASVNKIRVRMWGGGGGGGATAAGTGTQGSTSVFGGWTCVGGFGGVGANGAGGAGGTGGVSGGGSPGALIYKQPGQKGGAGTSNASHGIGGIGGSSIYLGGGGLPGTDNTTGTAAVANTGSGGGGANGSSSNASGGGGGSGEFQEFWVPQPLGSWTYTAGGGGAGATGTNTGGAGAAGQIYIEEYYF